MIPPLQLYTRTLTPPTAPATPIFPSLPHPRQTAPRRNRHSNAAESATEHLTPSRPPNLQRPGPRARPIFAGFALGAACAAFVVYRASHPATPARQTAPALSDSTRAVLQHLGAPSKIRFYSTPRYPVHPASVTAYAGRVSILLNEYQQASDGRLKVTVISDNSDAADTAAAGDGLEAFNRSQGAVSYFGIALQSDDRRETLARLAPEWEPALESDLTRAIARVATRPRSRRRTCPHHSPGYLQRSPPHPPRPRRRLHRGRRPQNPRGLPKRIPGRGP
ncbi:MAG: Gldg family protein [Verrucomicrobiota bacterium]